MLICIPEMVLETFLVEQLLTAAPLIHYAFSRFLEVAAMGFSYMRLQAAHQSCIQCKVSPSCDIFTMIYLQWSAA